MDGLECRSAPANCWLILRIDDAVRARALRVMASVSYVLIWRLSSSTLVWSWSDIRCCVW